MRKVRVSALRRISLLALAASFAVALVPGPAAAATCDTAGSDHVYSLKTFRGATCGSATVISERLARRFDRPSDFAGGNSASTIKQIDARGRKYTCTWQSGSSRGDIALWACRSGSRVVTWLWRYEQL